MGISSPQPIQSPPTLGGQSVPGQPYQPFESGIIPPGADFEDVYVGDNEQPEEEHRPLTDTFDNLAKKMSAEELQEIGNMVCDDYDADLGTRADWEKRHANWIKLFALQRDPKSFPWQNCSNIAMPMLTTSCIQFQSRALEALMPSKNVVKGVPIGYEKNDALRADRVERYMNYQLLYEMTEFKRSMDKFLFALPVEGTVIRKVFYDVLKGRLVSDYLSPSDFVINNNVRWLQDAERYSQRLYKPIRLIKALADNDGYYVNTEDIEEDSSTINLDLIQMQADKNVGVTQSIEVDNSNKAGTGVRELIEQYRYLKIGKDKLAQPYIVTVDRETRNVLRLISRKDPKTGKLLNHFIAYDFLPNPNGFYGFGFGLLLEDINEAQNSIMNQIIDSGTLQNLQSGFVLKGAKMKRGSIELSMGQFTQIDMNTDDINKAIMPFKFGQPSSVLYQVLGLLQQNVDRLTTVTELQTGELPSSDTPATAIVALVEQGMKVFSAIHKRTHYSFQEELAAMYQLNGLYLDVQQYFDVVVDKDLVNDPNFAEMYGFLAVNGIVDESTILEELKKDFNRPLDVVPVSDPNITSRSEKITKAQFVYQTTLQNPLTAQNMHAIYVATYNYFKALEIDDSIIEQILPASLAQPQNAISALGQPQLGSNEQPSFGQQLQTNAQGGVGQAVGAPQ